MAQILLGARKGPLGSLLPAHGKHFLHVHYVTRKMIADASSISSRFMPHGISKPISPDNAYVDFSTG